MPKQTFFNLPEDKRTRILDAAIAEIGSRPFEKVSVANIVEKANIPRGSFYQYFEDIKDLYRFVLQVIGERKMHYMTHVVTQLEDWDVFKTIRELYIAGLKFASENPELASVGNYFFREDSSLKNELFPNLEERGIEFYKMLLRKGKVRGEINPGVDLGMAAFILYNLTNAITNHYFGQTGVKEGILEHQEDYLELAGKMLDIMELGLRNRE